MQMSRDEYILAQYVVSETGGCPQSPNPETPKKTAVVATHENYDSAISSLIVQVICGVWLPVLGKSSTWPIKKQKQITLFEVPSSLSLCTGGTGSQKLDCKRHFLHRNGHWLSG